MGKLKARKYSWCSQLRSHELAIIDFWGFTLFYAAVLPLPMRWERFSERSPTSQASSPSEQRLYCAYPHSQPPGSLTAISGPLHWP